MRSSTKQYQFITNNWRELHLLFNKGVTLIGIFYCIPSFPLGFWYATPTRYKLKTYCTALTNLQKQSHLKHTTAKSWIMEGSAFVHCLPTFNVSTFNMYSDEVFILHLESHLQDTKRFISLSSIMGSARDKPECIFCFFKELRSLVKDNKKSWNKFTVFKRKDEVLKKSSWKH